MAWHRISDKCNLDCTPFIPAVKNDKKKNNINIAYISSIYYFMCDQVFHQHNNLSDDLKRIFPSFCFTFSLTEKEKIVDVV